MWSYLQSYIWDQEEIAHAEEKQLRCKYLLLKQIQDNSLKLKRVAFDPTTTPIVVSSFSEYSAKTKPKKKSKSHIKKIYELELKSAMRKRRLVIS